MARLHCAKSVPCHGVQWQIQDCPQGGAPTPKSAIIFQFFPRKLHENERIWTPVGGGARVPGAPPPLDPPMASAYTHSRTGTGILKSIIGVPVSDQSEHLHIMLHTPKGKGLGTGLVQCELRTITLVCSYEHRLRPRLRPRLIPPTIELGLIIMLGSGYTGPRQRRMQNSHWVLYTFYRYRSRAV